MSLNSFSLRIRLVFFLGIFYNQGYSQPDDTSLIRLTLEEFFSALNSKDIEKMKLTVDQKTTLHSYQLNDSEKTTLNEITIGEFYFSIVHSGNQT